MDNGGHMEEKHGSQGRAGVFPHNRNNVGSVSGANDGAGVTGWTSEFL